MTTTSSTTATDDQALKARHRAMWALGDYHAVATEIIADLGPTLVAACGIGPGQHVLDVAAGSGNVAIPAAATGAHVIATDLTPELLDRGAADADRLGVRLAWEVADAEDLPFDDDAFCTDNEPHLTITPELSAWLLAALGNPLATQAGEAHG